MSEENDDPIAGLRLDGGERKFMRRSELEREGDLVIVCMRIADRKLPAMFYPPHHTEACNDCGEEVMVADVSPKNGTRVCMHCITDRMKGGKA